MVMTSTEDAEGDEAAEVDLLVRKDNRSQNIFATPIPQKGLDSHEWVVRKITQMIQFLGYEWTMIKLYDETNLKAVLDSVRSYQGAKIEVEGSEGVPVPVMLERQQIMTEISPAADSQSDGMVEQAVRSEEGQVRTRLDALRTRLGMTSSSD